MDIKEQRSLYSRDIYPSVFITKSYCDLIVESDKINTFLNIDVVFVVILHNNVLQQFRYTYIFSVILLLFCYKDKHCFNTLGPSGKEE